MKPGRLKFAPHPRVLRQLRADVRAVVTKLGAAGSVGDTVALIVDELVNNAIEHGAEYRRDGRDLAVQVSLVDGRVVVEFFDEEMPEVAVRDLAAALADARNGMPSLENERGRGLFLMSVYLDGLRAEVGATGGLRLVGLVAKQ